MIFFTSDTHWNHTNIVGPSISTWKDGYRDFESKEQMNSVLIDNINAVVCKNDTLYHDGDFAFGNRKLIDDLRARINCSNIILILGNHDYYEKYPDIYNRNFRVEKYMELTISNTLITLFHYPIASWRDIGNGAFNLHGHSHGTYPPNGKQLDVGVDNPLNLYKPWSMDQIFNHMKNVDIVTVDHHVKGTNSR
jgi:calcineurin-like phosphoesterase family protein